MTGIELIAKERQEQIEKHGFTSMHDDKHSGEELTSAALYALTGDVNFWPDSWASDFLEKVTDKNPEERLIVAGALIAAEIDRLQREK